MQRVTETERKSPGAEVEPLKPTIAPAPEQPRDVVEEASDESFPASDPPSFTGATVR